MHINNLLKLSYWLDPSVLNERAGAMMWLVVLIGLAWAACGAFAFLRRNAATQIIPRDVALAQIPAGVIVVVVAVGRVFAIAPLGLRAGWLVAAIVAILPFIPRILIGALRDGAIGAGIDAMVFRRSSNRYAIGASRSPAFYYYNNAHRFQSMREDKSAWRFTTIGLWLALHLVGSMLVMSTLRQPLWYGPALAAFILIPHLLSLLAQSILRTRHLSSSVGRKVTPLQSIISNLNLTSLAPLFVIYLITAARWVVATSAPATASDGSAVIMEPWSSILNLPLWIIVMTVYALAISCYHATNPIIQSSQAGQHPSVGHALDKRFVQFASGALVVGTMVWATWNALTLHTNGVTGSDPYAYAQMGVDLATHGTVFHQFPLIRLTYDLNIPSDPIIHIGYKLPQDIQRIATTVWPPGYAVFTALGYLVGGEQGLYLITPLLSLLSLAVVWWFAHTMLAGAPPSESSPARDTEGGMTCAIAALAVALTATSYQQVEWQLIPMADIAAQLFSLLAVVLAVRAIRVVTSHHVAQRFTGAMRNARNQRLALAALSGIALGIAFDIRYTQVLIAPALLFTLLNPRPNHAADAQEPTLAAPTSRRILLLNWLRRYAAILIAFGVGAFVAALPVLTYHTLAFGSPFSTGSEELSNFSLARLPETLLRITAELASPREFGMLLPFIAIGIIALWLRNRRALITLSLYFAPLFILHIAYAYLRPRDILPLFPVLSFLAALGITWLIHRILQQPTSTPTPTLHPISHFPLPISRFTFYASRFTFYVSRPLLATVLLVGLSFELVLRSIDTLALPITHGFDAFGYLVREQRASFTQLADAVPTNAVIGCSLNSGAVDLYTHRLTFRPGKWTGSEAVKFVRALQSENTPVFILDDGAEVATAIESLRRVYTLTEITRLDMPFYFLGSGSENRKVALYKIEP